MFKNFLKICSALFPINEKEETFIKNLIEVIHKARVSEFDLRVWTLELPPFEIYFTPKFITVVENVEEKREYGSLYHEVEPCWTRKAELFTIYPRRKYRWIIREKLEFLKKFDYNSNLQRVINCFLQRF